MVLTAFLSSFADPAFSPIAVRPWRERSAMFSLDVAQRRFSTLLSEGSPFHAQFVSHQGEGLQMPQEQFDGQLIAYFSQRHLVCSIVIAFVLNKVRNIVME
jgi:hypothetical protein